MNFIFPFILIFLFVACNSPSSETTDQPEEKPNFVIFLCDDLGYGDLSSYGHPVIKTPHLDQLAKEGIRFTSFYAAAPVCSPSRAGLMTGKIPDRTGIYDWIPNNHVMHLQESETTIADYLKQAGYQTAMFGKWHLNGKFNQPEQPQPDDHGFDYWIATQNNAAPSHENPRNFVRNGEEVGELEGFSCQLVVDEAISWLQNERDSTKQFFHYIPFHEPHEPVASPDSLVQQYLPLAENEDEAQYFANVANMDAAVGRYLSALESMGLAENTLVIFTSDNGPETLNRYPKANRSYGSSGELRGMKLHVYEGGIRVPGMARWPGKIQEGTTSDVPVSSLDLLPTLCAITGVEEPAIQELDGMNVLPLLTGNAIEREKPLYWHYIKAIGGPTTALRDGDWKLIGNNQFGPLGERLFDQGYIDTLLQEKMVRYELYNPPQDIDETDDLSASRNNITDSLAAILEARFNEIQENAIRWQQEVK